MKKLIIAFCLTVGISIFVSCAKEFDFSTSNLSTTIEQNSDFAIPLVDASITLGEILPSKTDINRYLIIDGNNFMTLQYEYDFADYPAADFFKGYSLTGNPLPYIKDSVGPQIVQVGLDKFLNNGEFFLANPQITITIINYWDVPTQILLTDFYYYKSDNSPALPVIVDNGTIAVNRPLSPGSSAITEIKLDSTNSNMADVISAMPNHLSFGAIYETITTPPVSYDINPATIDSVKLKIEVPLDLRITNLVLADTSAADLTSGLGKDTSAVTSIGINLIVQNGFPFSLAAKIYFADENYAILDSVVNIDNKEIIIPTGITVAGKVTQSTESINSIQIENGKMANLLKAKYIITKITFNTSNAGTGETVKLYSDYKIGLKIGARIKLKLKT